MTTIENAEPTRNLLLSPAFNAKLNEFRELLRPVYGTQHVAAIAEEYFSKHMPDTTLERDALWWICVLQRDMTSFCNTFTHYELETWIDDGDDANQFENAPRTALILCPDYGYLATRIRGMHRKTVDAQWHEDRYRAIHEYMCAARLLPSPIADEVTSEFKSTLVRAIDALPHEDGMAVDKTLGSCGVEKLSRALEALQGNSVILVAMCGHGATSPYGSGQGGVFMLAAGDCLGEAAIARSLRGFKGTLILAYCMCHAAPPDPVGVGNTIGGTRFDESSPLHELTKHGASLVRIYTSARDDTTFPSYARSFAALMARMIREAPSYETLADWVNKTWPECRPLELLPSRWRPPPIVSISPLGLTGRFLSIAANHDATSICR